MSAVKRRKGAARAAPVSLAEATAMVARYHALQLTMAELHADSAASIARIEAERDRYCAPLVAESQACFEQLRTWWAVAGEAMTDGKRKSTEIAGCRIGIRTSTPALKLPKGLGAQAAVDWLKALADGIGAAFVRTRENLDKQALIKALGDGADPREPSLRLRGFTVSQKEEFFIDSARPPEVDPIREDEHDDD